ncbi:MAG TPA: amidase [Gemmatimonadaceae bacterium]|nr:amidase [Gemmatimonadaceae bacterium]
MTTAAASATGTFAEYERYDGLGLAELVRRGEVSPRELVEAAIERIEARNPAINAVVHRMYDEALATAAGPVGDGPFAGVPFLLKDLVSWYAGTPVTSGSRILSRFIAPHDTEIVRRYRRSGVIVLGKTNTPEFGLTPFTEPALFGPTRNPWDLSRTPGGSSGGSAAAVASGMVPIAGGGDGGGSIRIPASCCGLFGLKPTRGRNPTGPVEGELWDGAVQEHVLTRSVRDSAAMLDAIAGEEAGAPYMTPLPERPFLAEVGADPGHLRIAFTDRPLLADVMHDDCRAALADTVALLESLGHTLVEASPPIDRDEFLHAFLLMVCGQADADLGDAEAMTGHRASPSNVEISTWALALLGRSYSAAAMARARRVLERATRAVGRWFADHEVDVLLTPTLTTPPFEIGALQPPAHEMAAMRALGRLRAGGVMKLAGALDKAAKRVFDWIACPPVFNITGQPAMSVPLAWNAAGLPIGMHFAGRFADEATLFRLASQLEAARPWMDRRPGGV